MSIWKTEKNICPFENILLLFEMRVKRPQKSVGIYCECKAATSALSYFNTHDRQDEERNMQNV